MARLGCCENGAYITGKCGKSRVCELTDASEIRWGRVLDDISSAQVTVPISGNTDEACCVCLADLEPFCHELNITRCGKVVWVGPVTQVTYKYDEVVIEAQDVLAWLAVRVPEITFDNTADPTGESLNDIAKEIIVQAMAEDDSPCVISNVVYVADSADTGTARRVYPAFVGTAFDYLKQLSETGTDFRVVGRSIIISGDDLSSQRLGVLQDEHFIGSDFSITKSGSNMANRWYVNHAGGAVSGDNTTSQASCTGLVERELPDDHGIPDAANAQEVADLYAATTGTTPRLLDIPEGSQLSPDAPFDMADLIPGIRINVALTSLCLPVTATFKLAELSVIQTAEDEAISISLSPINTLSGKV